MKQTNNVVVLAADGVGAAGVARADTDDSDGRTPEAEQDIDSLHHDTQEAEKGRTSRGAGLQNQ